MTANQVVNEIKKYLKLSQKKAVDNIAIKGVDILQRNFRESGKNANPPWQLSKKVSRPSLQKKYGNKTLIYRGNLSLIGAKKDYESGRVYYMPGPAAKAYALIQFKGGKIYRKGQDHTFVRRGGKESRQMQFARNNRKRGIVHRKTGRDYYIEITGKDYLTIPPVYQPEILKVVALAFKTN
jgi:hypothetical protein